MEQKEQDSPNSCIGSRAYLLGSPYYFEEVLGHDLAARAAADKPSFLLLNQPPVCNARCRRCFMPRDRRGRTDGALTPDEGTELITNGAKIGVLGLEISGEGEPLLSHNLESIIQVAARNGLTVTVITNGLLLSSRFLDLIADLPVALIVSLLTTRRNLYELDSGVPGSYQRVLGHIRSASSKLSQKTMSAGGHTVFRMALHTTLQRDNADDIRSIRSLCDDLGLFLSLAPLAPIGGGATMRDSLPSDASITAATPLSHNSIILSRSARAELGREVCGTCLYGLNIGYDGNLLLDAHAGYEIEDRLGNVRRDDLATLWTRQQHVVGRMFTQIEGYCPPRDPKWHTVLASILERASLLEADSQICPADRATFSPSLPRSEDAGNA